MGLSAQYCFVLCLLNYVMSQLDYKSRFYIPEFSGYHCNKPCRMNSLLGTYWRQIYVQKKQTIFSLIIICFMQNGFSDAGYGGSSQSQDSYGSPQVVNVHQVGWVLSIFCFRVKILHCSSFNIVYFKHLIFLILQFNPEFRRSERIYRMSS